MGRSADVVTQAHAALMFPRRPGRINGFQYTGFHRYSFTMCTKLRKRFFSDAALVTGTLSISGNVQLSSGLH